MHGCFQNPERIEFIFHTESGDINLIKRSALDLIHLAGEKFTRFMKSKYAYTLPQD